MNKFKRSCLYLCLALVCCVGFLLTDSITVLAYQQEDNFYPLFNDSGNMQLRDIDNNTLWSGYPTISDNTMVYANPYTEGINQIVWYQVLGNDVDSTFSFPFDPDIYDYYLLGNLIAKYESVEESTFKPTQIVIAYQNMDTDADNYYSTSDFECYNIDSRKYAGFGFSVKVDFASANNTGISYIRLFDDKDGTGNKPANLALQLGILAVDKTSSIDYTLAEILNQLEQMESSINSSIASSADQITNSIESQYDMAEDEDFGVDDIRGNVEEKLGVLNFGADTLNNFLDLFSPANASGTTITFPSFSIDVQGVEYTIWNDIEFDLSFLEENFGVLITAVRTVTVMCVWLAVLSYLVKAKDQLINNRG